MNWIDERTKMQMFSWEHWRGDPRVVVKFVKTLHRSSRKFVFDSILEGEDNRTRPIDNSSSRSYFSHQTVLEPSRFMKGDTGVGRGELFITAPSNNISCAAAYGYDPNDRTKGSAYKSL